MPRRTTYTPSLQDRLEDRVALSHLAVTHLAPLVAHDSVARPDAGPVPATAHLVLTGTVVGRVPLTGSGSVSPMGHVTSSGTLTARGAEPVTYSGTVRLIGPAGSVTVSLIGRLFGPQYPGERVNLTYTITGGTGAFKGATGSGHALYSPRIASPAGDFALTFGAGTPPA